MIKAWPPSVFLWSDHGCVRSLSNYIVHMKENINMLKFFRVYIIHLTLYEAFPASQICKQFLVLLVVVNEFEIFGICCIYAGKMFIWFHLKKTSLNIFKLNNSDVMYSSSVHLICICVPLRVRQLVTGLPTMQNAECDDIKSLSQDIVHCLVVYS